MEEKRIKCHDILRRCFETLKYSCMKIERLKYCKVKSNNLKKIENTSIFIARGNAVSCEIDVNYQAKSIIDNMTTEKNMNDTVNIKNEEPKRTSTYASNGVSAFLNEFFAEQLSELRSIG